MKRFMRLKTSLTTSLVIFFLIGAFDIARLFFHPDPSYPVLEKIIGAAHFLSIYILIGAFFGVVKSGVQSVFLASPNRDIQGPRHILVDFLSYPPLALFLALMYFVHTRLIAKSLLSFVSLMATLFIVLLSAATYFILYKISLHRRWDERIPFSIIIRPLHRVAWAVLVFAVLMLPLTSYYFSKYPYDPFFSPRAAGQEARNAAGPNIVLITVDTLRADYVGCYGNSKVATPNIDELAKGGVTFVNAIAQASLTTPSHASIVTGTYVRTHLAGENCEFLDDSVTTLAEALKSHGYATAAFVSAYPLRSDCSGIGRGFELFNDQFSRLESCRRLFLSRLSDKVRLSRIDRPEQKAGDVNRKALFWLRRNFREKFFLWIHYYDPHTPYAPPKRFKEMYTTHYKGQADGYPYGLPFWKKARPEDIEHMISLYQGEISYTDDQIGVFHSELERLGLAKNTLIVFTSDHGEGLSEHSKYFVHQTLYDHDIKVPLILRGENILPAGKRVTAQVQSIDIMPTVLDVLDIPVPKGVEGSSLLDLVFREDSGPPEDAYSERGESVSIRTPGWKMIVSKGGTNELYDLEKDGAETQSLSSAQSPGASELLLKLGEYEKKASRKESKKKKAMTKEAKEKLRSLGYTK